MHIRGLNDAHSLIRRQYSIDNAWSGTVIRHSFFARAVATLTPRM